MSSKEIFVEVDKISRMPMYCRGGANCCNKDHSTMCVEGEGDCNTDNDCAGVLQCGKNNCLSFHPAGGGLWDADDDCCERKCTPQHPCKVGEGQCLTDADCLNPGWAKCGVGTCLNTTYFPNNIFIFNTPTFGFNVTDACCYRVCSKNYHLCGLNEIGCQKDEDCLPGLYCKTDASKPFCADIDECDPGNGIIPGYLMCGDNALCVNTIGSFNCSCNQGYQSHVPWQGCSDINECASSLTFNCSLFTNCFNIPGNYTCKCRTGFQGDPALGCFDIDECKDPILNSCNGGLNPYGINAETYGGEDVKYFKVKKSPDLFSIKIRFELATPDAAYLRLCLNPRPSSCYGLVIGGNLNTKFSLLKNEVTKTSVTHTITENLAVHITEFKTFWMEIQLKAGVALYLMAGSANDPASISFTDNTSLISVGYIGLSTNSSGKTAFWRNIRVGNGQQSCHNNFGSYFCVDIENDEYFGIGSGGISDAVPNIGKPAVVTRDMISCSENKIPPFPKSIISHGMAALENWLFVCGGQSSISSDSGSACMKYNMDIMSGVWVTSTSLPGPLQDFGMLSFKGKIFIMGGRDLKPSFYGYSYSKANVYSFSLSSNAFTSLASIPKPIFGQCVICDESNDTIWSIGGHIGGYISEVAQYPTGSISDVYTYTVTTNNWALHSNLNYVTKYTSCGMVTLRSGSKRILVLLDGELTNSVQFWNFDTNTGWFTTTYTPVAGQFFLRMVSLTPYSVLAVGGETRKYTQSQQNFFSYNLDYEFFESGFNYIYNDMYRSAWTRVKKSYRAFANCVSIVKYAAVGWGGGISSGATSYTTQWDVLLRSRSTSGTYEPKSPVRCDTAIPDLSPGKFTPGITSVSYLILVCGGNQYGKAAESTCTYLDTSLEKPAWTPMQSMPVARGDFPLVTYGDSVFAIGGIAGNVYLNQVDRWTKTRGWVRAATHPGSGIGRHCAVADEGYDKIYSMGGFWCNPSCYESGEVFEYTISTNTWVTFKPFSNLASNIGCAITRRGGTGNRLLLLDGDTDPVIQYYDLTSGTSWKTLPTYQTYGWDRPKLVSVTQWEVYKMGGYCSGCGYG